MLNRRSFLQTIGACAAYIGLPKAARATPVLPAVPPVAPAVTVPCYTFGTFDVRWVEFPTRISQIPQQLVAMDAEGYVVPAKDGDTPIGFIVGKGENNGFVRVALSAR